MNFLCVLIFNYIKTFEHYYVCFNFQWNEWMIITLYIILFYYEKVVVKFYNCIKQIIVIYCGSYKRQFIRK